jgi:predicted GNAT family acetyltransferase
VVVVTAIASTRRLAPGDEAALDAFLVRFSDSAMFLRSNLRAVGLGWHGRAFEGHWIARLSPAGEIAGVACHAWNGNLLLQDDDPIETVRAALRASVRAVAGLIGPRTQVAAARGALALGAPQHAEDQLLMALATDALIVPAPLASGAVIARRATARDLDAMTAFRYEFLVEAIRDPAGEPTRAVARAGVEGSLARGTLWLLEVAGAPVATCDFNATLPDAVQLGGVFTPIAERRRGYAQAVVAGALVDARARGVARAVLFTDATNPSSTRAYARIGFTVVGEYAMVLY